MIKERLKDLRKLIQEFIHNKSVIITRDGKITIVCRFKPGELKVEDAVALVELQKKLEKKLSGLIDAEYKTITVQKQPAFCYNTYARIISVSSASSKDKVKRYLAHFKKNELGKFTKVSYAEITFSLAPKDRDKFDKFLSMES